MKYAYFKSPLGNFGDDLNPWLWTKLFGEEDINDDVFFLGIGSILFPESPMIKSMGNSRKIIFGTGIRPSKEFKKLEIDSTWDVRFLRGPLSAMSQNNAYEYIADAAYAFRQLQESPGYISTTKKYKVSLIPFFRSVDYFDWKGICEQLGYHYISPFSENGVEFTLSEIAASEMIITEAMHGAILADILRVPWHRYILSTPFTEGPVVSEFKWMDWLFSVNLGLVNTSVIKLYRKELLNRAAYRLTSGVINSEMLIKRNIRKDILNVLSQAKDFYLSSDQTINRIDERIFEQVQKLQQERRL
ncbi:polysaccharide pyruvyl transferase family protein [Dyadobacter sp. CY107]|uniref:polysaccharide pyruvyl transferase family protein n=1 Tax=Dyadobacter fanqingshengii TaxID=2906443 RepID=UPI001F2AEA1D|nr:polysaccharide pyruvyl transferase family protein [Dyadobacter fanqingshengii]MCF2504705.1 polysaccharide pyruvyl transferase family protein [Dyadobacter fanqingshengii]